MMTSQEKCEPKLTRTTYAIRNGIAGVKKILVSGKWRQLAPPVEIHPQKRTRRNLGGSENG